MESQPVIILGAGHYAEEIADLACQIPNWQLTGFVEGVDRRRCEKLVEGLPVFWIDEIGSLAETVKAVCAVGSPRREIFIQQATEQGIQFTKLLHPKAIISPSAVIETGSIIFPGAVIAAHVRLGQHVIVSRGALLGHHLQVGDFTTISPGANIASSVKIGARTQDRDWGGCGGRQRDRREFLCQRRLARPGRRPRWSPGDRLSGKDLAPALKK